MERAGVEQHGGGAPPDGDADAAGERSQRPRLTLARIAGLDRSGPPPPETLRGAPLRPWTIPNLVGYARLALTVAFIVVAIEGPQSVAAATLIAIVAWGDQLDGLLARLTGQYSRLGTLLDPIVDRIFVLSMMGICFAFDLLPRWAIVVLLAREAFMLLMGQYWLRRGLELRINWFGRLGVWPTMGAPFFAVIALRDVGAIMLYVGLALSLLATAAYARDGIRTLRAGAGSGGDA